MNESIQRIREALAVKPAEPGPDSFCEVAPADVVALCDAVPVMHQVATDLRAGSACVAHLACTVNVRTRDLLTLVGLLPPEPTAPTPEPASSADPAADGEPDAGGE